MSIHSFNPTLVRLRLSHPTSTSSLRQGFNPTLVRLRPFSERAQGSPPVGFNPTLVRLRLARTPPPLPLPVVSIPRWFD